MNDENEHNSYVHVYSRKMIIIMRDKPSLKDITY